MKDLDLFAGANSARGFYSRYRYLALGAYRRVYILKGCPGSGKSTIIKEVAKGLTLPLEKYHCTAAPDSLDGLVIPGLGVSLLDGTPPHTVWPLAKSDQRLVDLASCLDEGALAPRRQQVQDLEREIAGAYKAAYAWLARAGQGAKRARVNQDRGESLALVQACLGSIREKLPDSAFGLQRNFFATAITGGGIVNFLPRLAAKTRIALIGEDKAFKERITTAVARHLARRKIPALFLYCSLEPQRLEHIYIPGSFALISSHFPHPLPQADEYWGLEQSGSSPLEGETGDFLTRGMAELARAARLHAELEGTYNPCLDFTRIAPWARRIAGEIREDLL